MTGKTSTDYDAVSGILGGLGMGLYTGKTMAGQSAHKMSPYGKKTKKEELARRAAIVGAPAGGLLGLGVQL
ncbi:MAG: hypothetical protein N2C14_28155, partial [Planctomycetales bacterium]